MAILFSEGVVKIFNPVLSFTGNETKTEVPSASLGSTLIFPFNAKIRFLARVYPEAVICCFPTILRSKIPTIRIPIPL